MANLSNINGKFVVEQTTGYVGVGTTDPNFLIEAAGTNSEIALNSTSGSIYRVRSTSSDAFIITKNGVGDRLVIDGAGNSTFAGNVGIGAAASDGNLHVRKTGVNTGITNVLMNANFADGSNGSGLSIGYRTDETTAVLAARTATGNIAFYSYDGGWSESMRIKNNGNVGIGTSSPSEILHLNAPGTGCFIRFQNTGGSGVYIGGRSEVMEMYTNGSEKMRITSTGNVGIGTTSIDSSDGRLKLSAPSGASNVAGIALYGNNSGGFGGSNVVRSKIESQTDGTAFGAIMKFYTNDTSNVYQERMRIGSSGNVGIGTTATSLARLNVYDTTAGQGTSRVVDISNSVDANINIWLSQSGAATKYAEIASFSTIPLVLNNVSGGNVGIGTTSPVGKLNINTGLTGITYDMVNQANGSISFSNNSGGTAAPTITGKSNNNIGLILVSGTNDTGPVADMYFDVRENNNTDYSTLTSSAYRFNRAGNPLMTILRSGNVGIGTTSPGYTFTVFKSITNDWLALFGNTYNGAGNGVLIDAGNGSSGEILRLRDKDGNSKVSFLSNGNVGIGTTGPSNKLSVNGIVGIGSSDQTTLNQTSTHFFMDMTSSTSYFRNTSTAGGGFIFRNSNIGDFEFDNEFAGNIKFNTSNIERMRIDSSGNVDISDATIGNAGTRIWGGSDGGIIYMYRPINQGTQVMRFYVGSTSVGYIGTSNSGAAFTSNSDYRLKENVVELTGALDRISELKPSRFNFIVEPNKTVDGFLAHEVQDIVPEAVFGEKDAVDEEGNPDYQTMEQSKLVPLLVAAIQELKADNDSLKARIETLENN